MIPIAKPLIGEEEKRVVLAILESGKLSQGKLVEEFEKQFAAYIGVRQAIATSNGTTALHAALLAHDIGTGDEVITTPFSFIATANAVRMCGATPVFVDVDEKTFNTNPKLIEVAITPKTKAILPVHLFGQSCDMTEIMGIAKQHNLFIIEDACQAHGAKFDGKKVGSFGTGCFSFYPTKNMTTGEGGMITTNDDALAKKIRKIISHGSEQKYFHDCLGYNYRMTDIAAAMGIEQLKKLDGWNKKRRENAAHLTNQLKDIPGLVVPEITPHHVFHQYTIRVTTDFSKKREELIAHLQQLGIGATIFYPLPIHRQKAYAEYSHFRFPVAERIVQEVLSLPVHPALTPENLDAIVQALKEAE